MRLYHVQNKMVYVEFRDLGNRLGLRDRDLILSQNDLISSCISIFYRQHAISETVQMPTITMFTIQSQLSALQPLNLILRRFNVEILYTNICQNADEQDHVLIGLIPLNWLANKKIYKKNLSLLICVPKDSDVYFFF